MLLRGWVEGFKNTMEFETMALPDELKGMKLILIDDDELLLDALTSFFEEDGCFPDVFSSAEDAVQAILQGRRYDIAICDYFLPGMNGYEFFEWLSTQSPHTLRVMVTAYGRYESIDAKNGFEIQGFLQKPLTARALEETVYRLIGLR